MKRRILVISFLFVMGFCFNFYLNSCGNPSRTVSFLKFGGEALNNGDVNVPVGTTITAVFSGVITEPESWTNIFILSAGKSASASSNLCSSEYTFIKEDNDHNGYSTVVCTPATDLTPATEYTVAIKIDNWSGANVTVNSVSFTAASSLNVASSTKTTPTQLIEDGPYTFTMIFTLSEEAPLGFSPTLLIEADNGEGRETTHECAVDGDDRTIYSCEITVPKMTDPSATNPDGYNVTLSGDGIEKYITYFSSADVEFNSEAEITDGNLNRKVSKEDSSGGKAVFEIIDNDRLKMSFSSIVVGEDEDQAAGVYRQFGVENIKRSDFGDVAISTKVVSNSRPPTEEEPAPASDVVGVRVGFYKGMSDVDRCDAVLVDAYLSFEGNPFEYFATNLTVNGTSYGLFTPIEGTDAYSMMEQKAPIYMCLTIVGNYIRFFYSVDPENGWTEVSTSNFECSALLEALDICDPTKEPQLDNFNIADCFSEENTQPVRFNLDIENRWNVEYYAEFEYQRVKNIWDGEAVSTNCPPF